MLLAAALSAAVLLLPATPVSANTTRPPLPPELAGLTQLEVGYGQAVTLQFTGTPPDFEHPVICGELGCVYNTIGWGLPPGSTPTSGCGPQDTACTFTYTPPGYGDNAETWQKATVAHLQGSSTVSSTSYAILGTVGRYTVYPELIFPTGDPDEYALGRSIFLVRGGTTPDASSCSSGGGGPTGADPDCMVIAGASGARNVPEGSTWTIYGSLASASGAVTGLAGFTPKTFTVTGDNLLGSPVRITHVTRPSLAVTVSDLPTTIPLNHTATVHVTVTAVGGQAGEISSVTFPRGLLTSGPNSSLETALQIVSPTSAPGPFTLTSGQSQSFAVTVKGVQARTNVFVSSQATGTTDEGQDRIQNAPTLKTNVVDDGTPPPDEPDDPAAAPAPPVIATASGGAPGTLSGTVSGAPGSTVQVRLATAAASASCPRLMSGAGITTLGMLTVAIPGSGTASFSHSTSLAPNSWAYGTTVASSKTSDVSACRRVGQAPATVGLALAKKKVKAGKRGRATVTVAASGLPAAGTVTVREGTRIVGTATLTPGDRGRVTIRLSARPKGKHTLIASYAGSADVVAATSSAVVLIVKGKG